GDARRGAGAAKLTGAGSSVLALAARASSPWAMRAAAERLPRRPDHHLCAPVQCLPDVNKVRSTL
ncbi:MAG: hypothetical protein E6708_30970, partial [Bradyrhizobium sp.]|nr:hypothetical protein [Bradyrhizobium sp.]